MSTVKAEKLAKTFDCKSPGCDGTARSQTGRHAYCDRCRVARGTALPDGTPIEAKPQIISRRRKGKTLGPFEARVILLLDAAREVDLMVARYKAARPALEQALGAWRAALASVNASEQAATASVVAEARNGDGSGSRTVT
jgi:hypothetical protein